MSLHEILESSLAVAINEEQKEDREAEVKIFYLQDWAPADDLILQGH